MLTTNFMNGRVLDDSCPLREESEGEAVRGRVTLSPTARARLGSKRRTWTIVTRAGSILSLLWFMVLGLVIAFYKEPLLSKALSRASGLKGVSAEAGTQNGEVSRLAEEIRQLRLLVSSSLFDRFASSPAQSLTLEDVSRIHSLAKELRRLRLRLDGDLVQRAAERLLEVSDKNDGRAQDAWNAAVELASYKSFLRQPGGTGAARSTAKTSCLTPWTGQGLALTASGAVEHCGAQALDGFDLSQVTFRGGGVYYGGGPLQLREVSFEDCDFWIQRNAGGRKLLEALLRSDKISILSLP